MASQRAAPVRRFAQHLINPRLPAWPQRGHLIEQFPNLFGATHKSLILPRKLVPSAGIEPETY